MLASSPVGQRASVAAVWASVAVRALRVRQSFSKMLWLLEAPEVVVQPLEPTRWLALTQPVLGHWEPCAPDCGNCSPT